MITFVDSDDTIDKDMYEFLVELMVRNNADISHCGYKRICGDNIILVNDTKKYWYKIGKKLLDV